MSSQQRRHDNELPDPEPQRVCRCCGHWRHELDFDSAASHVCCECDGELAEKTPSQPDAATGETNDSSDKLLNVVKVLH